MVDFNEQSVVQYLGLNSRKSATGCGYCKSSGRYQDVNGGDLSDDESKEELPASNDEKRTVSFGLGAIQFYTAHLNVLLDSGWSWVVGSSAHCGDIFAIVGSWMATVVQNKFFDIWYFRSGRYLYKPINEETCCPLYSIRLDVNEFRITRSQRRILRVWQDYLLNDKRPSNKAPTHSVSVPQLKVNMVVEEKPKRDPANGGIKRKTMRRTRAISRMKEKGIDVEKYQTERALKEERRRKTLEALLEYPADSMSHTFEVRLLKVGSAEFIETLDESFLIYKKYQELIHNDKVDRRGYERFLVDNSFTFANSSHSSIPSEGSYHQHYVIDGKIVAVGVIDILPQCVSATYFYYDPDYKFLNFGTYSALSEIAFVRRICQSKPQCHYYYLGYYVHDCPKMNYKASFHPSELLCNNSHRWFPASECIQKIVNNEGRFTYFSSISAAIGNSSEAIILEQCPSTSVFKIVPVNNVNQQDLHLYTKYVGPLCSQIYAIFEN